MLLTSMRLDIHLKMIESAFTRVLGDSDSAHQWTHLTPVKQRTETINRFASVRCHVLSVGIECECMSEWGTDSDYRTNFQMVGVLYVERFYLSHYLLRPIYTVRFLLTIVACDFYSARCSRHEKIVYDFHDIKLPVATIVVGF